MTDYTPLIEQLRQGTIERERRWSGDCHTDLGGSVDWEATEVLMNEAADAIENLTTQLTDAQSALEYIKQNYGQLYGVGWDRVIHKGGIFIVEGKV